MPTQSLFQHILTKICFGLVAICLFITLPTPVSAQESGVFARHELQLNLQDDFTATATYVIDITNNNDSPLSTFTVQVPFTDVKDTRFYVNGHEQSVLAQPITDGTSFTSFFPGEAVLAHAGKKLMLTFTSGRAAKANLGLIQIFMGKVNADHIVTDFVFSVRYPTSFPQLVYTSSPNQSSQANEVRLVGTKGHLVQWGNQIVGQIDERLPVDYNRAGENILFNFFSSNLYQRTEYLDMQNVNLAAQDRLNNVWGITVEENVLKPIEYSLIWKNNYVEFTDTEAFPQVDYARDAGALPQDLEKSVSEPEQEKLRALYDYMLHNFAATRMERGQGFAPVETWSKVAGEQKDLNVFQFAQVMAGYCQLLVSHCVVAYGYLAVPNFGAVDGSQPHVWVEAVLQDGKLLIMDPYLQLVTGGLNFFDVPSLGRLRAGVWDPELREDAILGLATGAPRPRPSIAEILQPDPVKGDYSLSSNFPARIRGGEFYSGNLVVDVEAREFMPLKSILFNGEDVTQKLLQIGPRLQRVMVPRSANIIEISWQREPSFLADGERTLITQVVPESDLLPATSAVSTIQFVPNPGALMAVLAVIAVGVVFVLSVGGKLYMEQLRFDRKLRARYTRRKGPANGGEEIVPPERVVHRIQDR